MKAKEITLKINRSRLFLTIAVSFLLLTVYILGFVGGRDRLNEESLRDNYNQLLNFEENNEWGEIYDQFILPDLKIKVNREKFIEIRNNARNKEEFVKRDIEVHAVVVRDNLGFIDRTSKKCLDEECTQYKSERIYKKWAFIDGHWYTSGETACIRKEPYTKPPEFDRAISIIRQRLQQWTTKFANGDFSADVYNCVNIKYADLKTYGQGPEGVFYFDEQVSTPENLLIQVDYSYQIKDDLLTAILLMHEFTHVSQFLEKYFDNIDLGCVENEVLAFINELNLIIVLNREEINSLNARLNESQLVYYNPNLDGVLQSAIIQNESLLECQRKGLTSSSDCFWDVAREKIKAMVTTNTYYQEQCRLYN